MTIRLPRVPTFEDPAVEKYLNGLVSDIQVEFQNIQQAVGGLSTGRRAAVANEQSAIPTTGVYALGDFVARAAPDVSVSAGLSAQTRFVHVGWTCVQDGSASVSSFVAINLPVG